MVQIWKFLAQKQYFNVFQSAVETSVKMSNFESSVKVQIHVLLLNSTTSNYLKIAITL